MLNTSSQLLEEFSKQIRKFSLTPLWERTTRLEPGTNCVPFAWYFSDTLPLLMKASEVIEKKQADRRVLVMENPSIQGSSYISNSLFAGLQIIMPGEIAPSHRHSPNALRFLMMGKGAYTSIAGEKIEMNPGDFIVTKNWDWHDHGNEGDEPVVWMDGLDTPLTALFGSHFRENYSNDIYPLNHQISSNESEFGFNLSPINSINDNKNIKNSLLIYSYVKTKNALLNISQNNTQLFDLTFGFKLKYLNPINGLSPFQTMSVFIQSLPLNFKGKKYRSTENVILNIAEGECSVDTETQIFNLKQHDIMVIPSWTAFSFSSKNGSIVFSFSDKIAQESLGFWREEYLT